MKRTILFLFLSVSLLVLVAGCGLFETGADNFLPLKVTCVDGSGSSDPVRLREQFDYYPNSEDVPGCGQVIAWLKPDNAMYLSFCFYNTTQIGGVLDLERLHFGIMISSNSRDYAQEFTGEMRLKEKTGKRVVIRMDNVRFTIARGEYILNGDLIAVVK